MKFGDLPLDEAAGAILVHSVTVKDGRLRKGRALAEDDIERLRATGMETVAAARLEPDDVPEDDAAAMIAAVCGGPNVEAGVPFTGRCNLTATAAGLAVIDAKRIDRLNQVNEAVTVATAGPYEVLAPGQIVATVKIITFAVERDIVEACTAVAAETGGLVRVAAFRPTRVGLIQTVLPGLKKSLLEKAVAVTRDRLATMGATLDTEIACDHDVDAVAQALTRLEKAGCRIIMVLGASAIVDRRDVVPVAIEMAGGRVDHFGMPVDPGHLMLLARLGGAWVLGIPGSARSPRPHGFDWVLQRLVAGIDVTGGDLMRMGVGGLLKEIPGRPMPRERARADRAVATPRPPRVAAIILAAGQSRRMGRVNKLLAEIDGRPMVAQVAEAVAASSATPVVVVTGHEDERVRSVLAGREVVFVHNPDYAEGLSTSLRRGLAALPAEVDGAVICLGDMPTVTAAHIDRLIAAFAPASGKTICVPTHDGKRGNPVLWGRRHFREMIELAGDVGARHLIGQHADAVAEVPMEDAAVLLDLDTPEALAAHLSAGKAEA